MIRQYQEPQCEAVLQKGDPGLHALHWHHTARRVSHRHPGTCHCLARRPGTPEVRWPYGPASACRVIVAVRISLRQNAVSHNPVKGVKRPKAESGEGKTPALGDHQARELLAAPGEQTVDGRRGSRNPVDAALSRATARRALQAKGQRFPALAARCPASQGLRQGGEDAVSAAAPGH